MILDETQRQQVAQWIQEGLKLSELQKRLDKEMGIRMTYMEVRCLMDDLKLQPADPVVVPKPEEAKAATPPAAPVAPSPEEPAPGKLALEMDAIPHPGTVVSGKVTFSDGMTATWYLDQSGRLGMAPSVKGYRPTAADVQQFQASLEEVLSKSGM